jgi:hypothetical protein
MNHIVMGTDDLNPVEMWLGLVGIGLVVLSSIVAHYFSCYQPRGLQPALKSVTYPMQLLTLNRLVPHLWAMKCHDSTSPSGFTFVDPATLFFFGATLLPNRCPSRRVMPVPARPWRCR